MADKASIELQKSADYSRRATEENSELFGNFAGAILNDYLALHYSLSVLLTIVIDNAFFGRAVDRFLVLLSK